MASAIATIIHQMAGGGSPGQMATNGPGSSGISQGNGADKAVKEQVGVLGNIRKNTAEFAKGMSSQPRFWTKALKTMGIQMGIAGILKQSQIFTSTLGSLFQILGAFVDIMLAPWIPVIVPGLRKLADQIPRMRVIAQKFFDWATSSAWPVIQKIWNLLTNVFKKEWWSDALKSLVPDILGLPDALDGIADKLGTTGVAIAGLTATWIAAKTARYGLQLTRWIPFVNAFTEPVRLLGKGVDRLFNETAKVIGKGFAKGFNLLARALGFGPDVPKVAPRNRGLGKPPSPDEFGPGRRVGGSSSVIPDSPSRIPPTTARPRTLTIAQQIGENIPSRPITLAGLSQAERLAVSLGDDADSLLYRGSTRGTLNKNVVPQGQTYVRQHALVRGTDTTARHFTNVPNATQPERKFGQMAQDFADWLKQKSGTIKGKSQSAMKSLATQAQGKLQALLGQADLIKLANPRAAKLVGGLGAFAKALFGPIATVYMVGETMYDLKQMWDTDLPWFHEPGSLEAWAREAGHVGGAGATPSDIAVASMGREMMQNVGGWFGQDWGKDKQTSGEWMDESLDFIKMQQFAEGGALSEGKAFWMGMRAAGGGLGALMSLFGPVTGIAGASIYEGTKLGAEMNLQGALDRQGQGEQLVTLQDEIWRGMSHMWNTIMGNQNGEIATGESFAMKE